MSQQADDFRQRANLGMQMLTSLMQLVTVLVVFIIAPQLFQTLQNLSEGKRSWQEHVQREIEREEQHQQQMEAVRRQQLQDTLSRRP